MTNRLWAAAVALRIGDDLYKAPVFVLEATGEEAAEAKALEMTREAFGRLYGAGEGEGWKILHYSAEEIPTSILRSFVEAIDNE